MRLATNYFSVRILPNGAIRGQRTDGRPLSSEDWLRVYDMAAREIAAAWLRILGVAIDRKRLAIHLRQKKKYWQRPTAVIDALMAEMEQTERKKTGGL